MRLVDIENHIKEMIANDPNDPDIFNEIENLSYLYIKRYKKVNNDSEAKEVALLIAEDLYMKLANGKPIYSWCGYISKSLIGYIRKYRSMTQSEIFVTDNNVALRDGIVRMSSGGSMTLAFGSYDNINDSMCFQKIDSLIEKILDESARYYVDTSDWLNTYISILLTFINDGDIIPYCLNESETMYMRMLMAKVKEDLTKEIKSYKVESDNHFGTFMEAFLLNEGGSSDESE